MDYDQEFRDYINQVDDTTKNLLDRVRILKAWAEETKNEAVQKEITEILSDVEELLLFKMRLDAISGMQ